jgi:hypothetical protein
MVQLSATRCSCIAILWVSLVSFAAITLRIASQRVFVVVFSIWLSPETFGFTLVATCSLFHFSTVMAGHCVAFTLPSPASPSPLRVPSLLAQATGHNKVMRRHFPSFLASRIFCVSYHIELTR